MRVDDPSVSAEHALLRWRGVWELQDLHSRNGTFVRGARLRPGARVELFLGDEVGFGRGHSFRLVDADPPSPFAQRLDDGAVLEATGSRLLLPSEDEPEIIITRRDQRWWAERHGELRPVEDGAEVTIGAGRWRLFLPEEPSRTDDVLSAQLTLHDLSLRFSSSEDEEYVELVAVAGDRHIDLKARAHHYPLLLLARARLADAALPEPEQGWILQDELLRKLRCDPGRLHVGVHRLRRQLADAGVAGAQDIVERRPGTRQLRLGTPHVELIPVARERPVHAARTTLPQDALRAGKSS